MIAEQNQKRLVALSTAIFALLIATYPTLFFINPFWLEPFSALTVAQLVFLVAWPTQLIVWPTVYFFLKNSETRARILRVICLVWPASIVLVQIAVLATFGFTGLAYLLDKPMFIVSDVIVPFLYWKIAYRDSGS